jgi:hypothetical protein
MLNAISGNVWKRYPPDVDASESAAKALQLYIQHVPLSTTDLSEDEKPIKTLSNC